MKKEKNPEQSKNVPKLSPVNRYCKRPFPPPLLTDIDRNKLEKQKIDMFKALDGLKMSIDIMKEAQKYDAVIIRAKYLALVRQGFTKEEALELVKKQ